MAAPKSKLGRPKGAQKIAITGLVLPATDERIRHLAESAGSIGAVFDAAFPPITERAKPRKNRTKDNSFISK